MPFPSSPQTEISLNRHYPGLDGLRGIAILGVIIFHGIYLVPKDVATDHEGWLGTLYSLVALGWAGVDLFFVLSGFLITGILLETRGKTGYFKSFFARRFLRIFPVYYATLIALFGAVWLVGWHLESYRWLFKHQGYYWFYLQNWLIFKEGGPFPAFESVGHLWSLAVEEQFYLLWPFAVAAMSARRLIWFSLLIVLLVPAARLWFYHETELPHSNFYFLTPFRLDTLAMGSALACLAHAWPERLRGLLNSGRLLAVGCGALLLFIWWGEQLYNTSEQMITVGYSALAIISAVLIAEAICASTRGEGAGLSLNLSAISAGWLRTLGKYSYAMYIAHWPLIFITSKVLDRLGIIPVDSRERLALYNPELVGVFYLGGVIFITLASFIAAWVSWHVLEKHFLRLKSKFPRPV